MNAEQQLAALLAAHQGYMQQLALIGMAIAEAGDNPQSRYMLQQAIDRSTESIFWATHGVQAAPERRILSNLHG
jgi:hypothetical protein